VFALYPKHFLRKNIELQHLSWAQLVCFHSVRYLTLMGNTVSGYWLTVGTFLEAFDKHGKNMLGHIDAQCSKIVLEFVELKSCWAAWYPRFCFFGSSAISWKHMLSKVKELSKMWWETRLTAV
jgi:hypothetical protein